LDEGIVVALPPPLPKEVVEREEPPLEMTPLGCSDVEESPLLEELELVPGFSLLLLEPTLPELPLLPLLLELSPPPLSPPPPSPPLFPPPRRLDKPREDQPRESLSNGTNIEK
jgi:hypothetical protein